MIEKLCQTRSFMRYGIIMIKVFFSGSHRTGKTTLAERFAVEAGLAMNYTNVSKVKVQNASPTEIKNNFDLRFDMQQTIMNRIDEIVFKESDPFSVYDRSLIDVYGYTEYTLSNIIQDSRLDPDYASKLEKLDFLLENIVSKHQRSYSEDHFIFFYVPVAIEFKEDEKSFDKSSQVDVAECMENLIASGDVGDVIMIPKELTDFEKRVEFCLAKYQDRLMNILQQDAQKLLGEYK